MSAPSQPPIPVLGQSDAPKGRRSLRALWWAGAGLLAGLLLCLGMSLDRIPIAIATALFFGAPLAELVALIMALWAFGKRQGTVQEGIAAVLALICLGVWGWIFYALLTMPLIKLF